MTWQTPRFWRTLTVTVHGSGGTTGDDARRLRFLLNDGVTPFGHSTQLRVFVDPGLLQYGEVWAAAGTWNDNFGAKPNDIVRVSGGVVTDLKRA